MAAKRIRTTRLENTGQVAIEHAKVYRELRQKKLDPALASRMSAILVNHRVILEQVNAEARIAELEQLVEKLTANSKPTPFRSVA